MNRLTTDTPHENFETMLNFVYGKGGWAHIRHDGENADVPLTEWARKQCLNRGCDEFPAETPAEIDQEICDCMMDCPECPVARAYCFASQAVHMRDRLKMYEDVLFAEDGTELVSLEQLRTMSTPPSNPPLTLEELREMEGKTVWVEFIHRRKKDQYRIIRALGDVSITLQEYNKESGPRDFLFLGHYGKTWRAYRRRPEVSR